MSDGIQAPKGRKIIVSGDRSKQVSAATLMVEPDVQTLLNDALTVVAAEIIKLRQKSSRDLKPLDLAESRVLQGYVKALVDLSRENRERDDERDLSNLTDAEIGALAQRLLAPKGEQKNEP